MTKRVFVIGDTHFNHANIVRYCDRPFASVRIMNNTILHNWNELVDWDDIVYFLGDLSKGDEFFWRRCLNGRVTFIKGNHDVLDGFDHLIIEHKGFKFFLTHDPDYSKIIGWDDWVIHAHKHNNDLINFPFFNVKNKTINVSVEIIGYKPILLDDIVKKIKELN